MDWKKEIEEANDFTRNRQYDLAAQKYKEIIEGTDEDSSYRYWAMKHFADLVGFIHVKDFFRAIDIYQTIINEYEGEDGLYEWCQIDMAKTYMLAGMEMFEGYENMRDMLAAEDNEMADYLNDMKEKYEDYFTDRAEAIYKTRM